MLNFVKQEGWKVLELGNGGVSLPNIDVRVDKNPVEGVTHFSANLDADEWLEIGSDAFDLVVCQCFTEVATSPLSFLKQVLRVLKPGGNILFEAEYRNEVEEGSSILTPSKASKLFTSAGFKDVLLMPVSETRMSIEAEKGLGEKPVAQVLVNPLGNAPNVRGDTQTLQVAPTPTLPVESVSQPPTQPSKPASEIYNRKYFESYQGGGFLWDFPSNELIARKLVSTYSPQSVLELGCARGYVIKRLQDRGIRVQGVDVSKHAWMTRVCDPIIKHDLLECPWSLGTQEFDLCFTQNLLEHIPESKLEAFVEELNRVSNRGVHAVVFQGTPAQSDSTRCTLKTKDWWKRILPETHEVVDPTELTGDGSLPEDYVRGDGKIKLNLGCAFTMYHNGWQNLDVIDAIGFSQAFGYNFKRHDINQGLPYSTGVVDCIQLHHVLEHFSYADGLKLLRECRRVIRTDGAMRIVVPDIGICAWHLDFPEYLTELGEVNEGCQNAKTGAQRLWAMLGEGHKAFYDFDTIAHMLKESGWQSWYSKFRDVINPVNPPESLKQILRETIEYPYGDLSLFVNALPSLG
jgi:SAM-dependent methyltransferase